MGKTRVYIIGEVERWNPIKIGVSARVATRLKALQAGSPVRLGIYASVPLASDVLAYKVEREVHRRLEEAWLWGEWHAVAPEIALAMIEEVAKAPPARGVVKEWKGHELLALPLHKLSPARRFKAHYQVGRWPREQGENGCGLQPKVDLAAGAFPEDPR